MLSRDHTSGSPTWKRQTPAKDRRFKHSHGHSPETVSKRRPQTLRIFLQKAIRHTAML